MSPTETAHAKWTDWVVRPIVLFVVAYTIVLILHETAHALTAYALKIPSVLFHVYAQIDRTAGTLNQRALVRAAGPVFCLAVGLACWLAYTRWSRSRAALPLLYFAWFGVGTFFGNLISTPFVGDFSGLALTFEWPMPMRYATGLVGLLTLCSLSFMMGIELRKWAPATAGRTHATLGMVVLPVVVGTIISMLIFIPIPRVFWGGRIGESFFWIFAVAGTFFSRKRVEHDVANLRLGSADVAILLLAAALVRAMAGGIELGP